MAALALGGIVYSSWILEFFLDTGLDPVTIKSFLAFGMLLNAGAALDVGDVDEPWAHGVRTLIEPGLFHHITSETNR